MPSSAGHVMAEEEIVQLELQCPIMMSTSGSDTIFCPIVTATVGSDWSSFVTNSSVQPDFSSSSAFRSLNAMSAPL